MVKRWSVGVDGEDPNGNLVKYTDYAELERQRDALVAENAAIKVANEKLIRDQQAAWPIGLLDSFISEHSPETPSTDAALREIGAKAVEALIKNKKSEWLETYISDAQVFAQQLREGKV